MPLIALGSGNHGRGHAFERQGGFRWWTVSWVERGTIAFTRVLNEEPRHAAVAAPALVVIPPGVPYKVRASGVRETWLFIEPSARWLEWLDHPEVLPGVRVRPCADPRVAAAIDALRTAGDDPLLRDHACEGLLLLTRPTRIRHPLTEAAIAHLEADLAAPRDLVGLARAVGGSRSRLAEVFRADLGLPPMAWLERRRIETACGLLLATARPVQDIAEEVGFANPFHFATRFRALVGAPPSRWRRSPVAWSAG